MKTIATALTLGLLLTAARADDISWHAVDGGGATSTGGAYTVSGTAGQPDPGVMMTGGNYTLAGGFWVGVTATPAACRGDSNCDGVISWRDIDFFVAAMNNNVAAWQAMFAPGSPTCPFSGNDVNADGTVTWRDIDPLVAVMNTTCP